MSDMTYKGDGDGSEDGGAGASEDFDCSKEQFAASPSHQNQESNGEIVGRPSSSERTIEMKEKFKHRNKRERRTDLRILAQKEAEKRAQDEYVQRLGRSIHATPDCNLVIRQLVDAVGKPGLGSHISKQIQRESINLYAALDPVDPIDSMLLRQLIGLNHATMGCFERAAKIDSAKVRDVELRHGIKGSKAFGDMLRLRDSRLHKGRPTVTMEGEFRSHDPVEDSGDQGATPPRSVRDNAQRAALNGPGRKLKS